MLVSNPASSFFLCLVCFVRQAGMVSVFVELSLSLNMKLFIAVNLQTGEAYLTDMTRELQQKSQLLETSISVMKSLESADNTIPLLPKPDPVRAAVPQLEPHGFIFVFSPIQTLVCLLPGNIGTPYKIDCQSYNYTLMCVCLL